MYATGFSAGGHLAAVLACELPERILAAASVSGAYQPTECTSERPTPVVAFHGRDDLRCPSTAVRARPLARSSPVLDALGALAPRNGCTGGPDVEELDATVQRLSWSGCVAPTVLYLLADHGHAWPGHPLPFPQDVLAGVLAGGGGQPPQPLMVAIGETPGAMAANVLLTNTSIDASELIWDFFDRLR